MSSSAKLFAVIVWICFFPSAQAQVSTRGMPDWLVPIWTNCCTGGGDRGRCLNPDPEAQCRAIKESYGLGRLQPTLKSSESDEQKKKPATKVQPPRLLWRDRAKEADNHKDETLPKQGKKWKGCSYESAANITAQRHVERLKRQLQNNVLEREALRQENNNLIREAQKALGKALVGKLIEIIPLARLPETRDVLERMLSYSPSDEMMKKADAFVKQARVVREKIKDIEDQRGVILSEIEQANIQQEKTKKLLYDCRTPTLYR